MNYDPTQAPCPEQWLQADESARVDAVYTWFVESGCRNEDEALGRAAVPATLETQVASRDPSVVAETLEQLESEGLKRLLAMLAMASVLDEMLREITSQNTEFDLDAYQKRIRELDLELIETTAANNQPFGGQPPPFDSSQQRLLESFTERHADDEVLSFPAMAGFVLAVACAPRLALPSEWLPCLIGDIEFDTQQESEAVVGAIMSLLNWILDEAQSTPSQPLPADCRPARDPMANLVYCLVLA
jgi:ribosomal protein S10